MMALKRTYHLIKRISCGIEPSFAASTFLKRRLILSNYNNLCLIHTSAFYYNSKNFYDLLGVPKTATAAEIKKAYLTCAKKYHPDINPNNKQAKEMFQLAAEAYETLSDSNKRSTYDNQLRYGSSSTPKPGFQQNQQQQRQGDNNYYQYQWQSGGNVDAQKIFDDILREMFGGHSRQGFGHSQQQSQRPESIFDNFFHAFSGHQQNKESVKEANVELTFLEAMRGCTKQIETNLDVECNLCKGKGVMNPTNAKACSSCAGKGYISYQRNHSFVTQTCTKCGGAKYENRMKCLECGGIGKLTQLSSVEINIPAGVSHGEVLQTTYEGNQIYLTVHLEKNGSIWLDNDVDVHQKVDITVAQALLGGRKRIESVVGKLDIDIPPLSDSDDVIKFQNQGVTAVGIGSFRKTGDLYVHPVIVFPTRISEQQRHNILQYTAEDDRFHSDSRNEVTGYEKGAKGTSSSTTNDPAEGKSIWQKIKGYIGLS